MYLHGCLLSVLFLFKSDFVSDFFRFKNPTRRSWVCTANDIVNKLNTFEFYSVLEFTVLCESEITVSKSVVYSSKKQTRWYKSTLCA